MRDAATGMHESDGEEDDEDDDDDDCSSCGSPCDDPDEEEKKHFLDVCYSMLDYMGDVKKELMLVQEDMKEMDQLDAALWGHEPSSWINQIYERASTNGAFLAMMPSVEVCGADFGPDGHDLVSTIPEGHRIAERNSSKVRATLRQFVRDWAREGAEERVSSYGPLVGALQRHLPLRRGQRPPRVMCPGCGLGRLPFELAAMGYEAQGNEFSYHMLLGSHFVLNCCLETESYEIFPFVLCSANRRGASDHLRSIRIPDICPRTALPPHARLSMAAGEFVEIYGDQAGEWDAVASAFFLDTAKNIFLYIRVIASMLRPGGLFINMGPLLFHYSHMPSQVSVELSWEELRPFICRYFDFLEEEVREATYTTNPGSMQAVKYRCKYFVAKRNTQPVTGKSNPVY